MKTTPLPSVEERVKTICDCRKGSMDDKQYEATVEYNLTQDRNQAYTRLVEGIEGVIKYDIENPRPEYYVNRGEIGVYEHQQALNHWMEQQARNRTINDILENVVKPLYGKE